MVKKSNPNEICITRVYDAAVEAVWDAWTEPDQVAQWWGPRGFTITTHHKDLRVGGTWKYTMHGPDGTDWPNTTLYHEVERHKKLVYDHGATEDRPALFRVTVLFSEKDGKTTMEMTMAMATPEAANEIRKVVKKHGGESTWDRLAEYLNRDVEGREPFIITRSFDAPIDLLFEMWTDPKHFSQWLPPTGFTMKFYDVDIRPGGKTFWSMSDDGTVKMYGRAEYLEIERPNRIVYTQQFCDEKNSKVTGHPKVPNWPHTMLTTVTFAEEGPDCTRVRVRWEPTGETTHEELMTFINARAGMTMGWTGSFDKLDALLPTPAV